MRKYCEVLPKGIYSDAMQGHGGWWADGDQVVFPAVAMHPGNLEPRHGLSGVGEKVSGYC